MTVTILNNTVLYTKQLLTEYTSSCVRTKYTHTQKGKGSQEETSEGD